jgi:hypothetical protein
MKTLLYCFGLLFAADFAKSAELANPRFEGGFFVVEVAKSGVSLWDLFVRAKAGPWRIIQEEGETIGNPPRTVRFRVAKPLLPEGSGIFVAGSQIDSDGDGLTNAEEQLIHLSNVNIADTDGDGQTDGAEVAAGSSPLDFFNGLVPVLTRISGNQQEAATNTWLEEPLVVKVTANGSPQANAPLTVKILGNTGGLAATGGSATMQDEVEIRSDATGLASIWLKFGGTTNAKLNRVIFGTYSYKNGSQGPGGVGTADFLATLREAPNPIPANGAKLWLRPDSLPAKGELIDYWQGSTTPNSSAFATWPPLESILPRSTEFPPAAPNLRSLRAAHFDGTDDRLEFPSELAGTAMTNATVVCLYKPSAGITRTVRPPSLTFGTRMAGVSGQRYLLASEVAEGSFPWPDNPNIPQSFQFSVYRNFKYTEKWVTLGELRKTYGAAEILPVDPPRSNLLPGRRLDATANQFWFEGTVPNIQRPATPPSASDLISEAIGTGSTDWVSLAGWNWEYVGLDVPTRQTTISPAPLPPAYTVKYLNGQPVAFEENYYEVRATHYTHPNLTADKQPVATQVGAVGFALSAASNGSGTFELRDGLATEVAWNRNVDEYYPATASQGHSTTGWRILSALWNNKTPSLAHSSAAGWISPTAGLASLSSNITNGPKWLGGSASPIAGNHFSGDLAEMVIFPSVLTTEARQRVENYLGRRVGLSWDRNANGMGDGWEDSFLYARRSMGGFTASADPDADGLTNLAEHDSAIANEGRFTYPTLSDSDGDGLNDNAEPPGLSPTTNDSDGDGFLDSIECTTNKDGKLDLNGNQIPDGWDAFRAL